MVRIYFILLLLLLVRLVVFPAEPSFDVSFITSAGQVVREKFKAVYHEALPGREAMLLSGVVLGDAGEFDRKFKSQLADTGLTHIVAASGMNVTIFSGFIIWLLALLKLEKMQKVIISMIFIGFYTTVTGFEPPIVRASLMVGLTYLAMVLGRQNSGWWGLMVAAYLMLWVSPKLLGSASFLLSFTAMTGQVFLSSFLGELPKATEGRSLYFRVLLALYDLARKNFWQSFLAILFTGPIVLWFFAKFSLVSLLSNLLILWTVEPLMILGGLIGLSGQVWLPLAKFLAIPAGPLLAYFLGVVDALSRDYFLLNLKVTSWTFPVGYYLLLAAFVWWWRSGSGKIKENEPDDFRSD